MNSLIYIVLLAFTTVVTTAAHPILRDDTPRTVVEDVQTSTGNFSCWEAFPDENMEPRLSEPIFKFCQMIISNDQYFLNGFDGMADVGNSQLEKFFQKETDGFATTVVCVSEALELYRNRTVFPFRCLCNREGCNAPGGLEKMISTNNAILPRNH